MARKCQALKCESEIPVTRNSRAKYCSSECSHRAHRDTLSKRCTHQGCDRPVRARSMCSMHYRQWERANGGATGPSSQWGPRRQANWKKRHAEKRGATRSETLYPESIYARDRWICGICGQPVDRTLTWPDVMSASLDHRVPLAHGGTHTRDNVQLAHFACNAKKGAQKPQTIVEALALASAT